MNLIEAMDDGRLFRPWFKGSSWNTWRAVLKAAHGLPMTADDVALFRIVAERDPPRKRVRELWVRAGRRAGKDSIASAIAAHSASFGEYRANLRPGETATVACLAVDRAQAKILIKYVRAFFRDIGMLKRMVDSETADGLMLNNGVEIAINTNNFRAVRGRSIVCAVLDECAFYRDEGSANPDVETYNAIIPGMITIPDAMLVGISSPYRKSGLLYTKDRDHYGRDSDDVLVVGGPSIAFNPTLKQKDIDKLVAADPAAGRSEWLGMYRDDIASYLDRDLVEGLVDHGVTARPPIPGVRYRSGTDPSGGSKDSFTLSVCHSEGDVAVVDCIVEIRAPFNPTSATEQMASVLKSYGLAETTGDRYAAAWVVDAFAKCGIKYLHSERDRSAVYAEATPLFTSGRVRLLDNRRLVNQLASLERRTSSGGKDRIDHGVSGSDDVANAVAMALVTVGKPAFVMTREMLEHFQRKDMERLQRQASGIYRPGENWSSNNHFRGY